MKGTVDFDKKYDRVILAALDETFIDEVRDFRVECCRETVVLWHEGAWTLEFDETEASR